MKKILLATLCFFTFSVYSQEKEPAYAGKNEIKANALMLVVGFADFGYERILSDETAVGVQLGFALDKEFEQKLYLSPYFRYYFGVKPAAGFFVEGFGMLNQYKIDEYYYSSGNGSSSRYNETVNDFALGFALGGKWITKSGFTFELSSGIGRNLFNTEKNDLYGHTFVGKGGLTVGYRF